MMAELGIDLPIVATRHPMVALRRPSTDRSLHMPVLDVAIDTYLIPRGDITLVGTLGTHDDDTVVDPETYRRGISNDEVARLSSLGRRRMPALGRGVMWGGWAGIYDESVDAHPIVDAVPDIDGLFCALGMSGNCFKLAPRLGELLARRIVDGPSAAEPLAPLRIDRFAEGGVHTRAFSMSVLA
jgi:sarcosine oxidase subunit beta